MRQVFLLVVLATVFAPAPRAAAQGFEGVIRQRSIMVDGDALYEILYTLEGEEMDEEDEFDEEQYLRAEVDRILDFSVDELLSMAKAGLEIEVEETSMHMKGAKARTDAGPFGYFIMDADEETLWMVNAEGSVFVKWTQADVKAAEERTREMMANLGIDPADIERAEPEASDAATLEPLSRTARVNGFEATGYRAESRDKVTVAWLVEDVHGLGVALNALAKRMEVLSGDAEVDPGSIGNLLWSKGLPVRIQSVGTSFGRLSRYEITDFLSVEPTSVADDLFEIPAGFREVSLEDLWR
ncbi:MAG: hypothetical protein BMS9Abin29_0994 [Gemmatimonadota bacterium]|nr:MAG: hypothetical protein BMS9Abin29_0994 [Gemmatimonadota bacterium]